ncbi:MAG: type VI secretion system protein TssA [endosymbiont of Galathealinum brachiosum]|uniref:Type VI secretion system protein TssA n=1 Tax=endosymbiont of Galathealinum brachiosum TaxID=2200906 RepID=A0A370DH17_9GAMM|nr:MAG: type VI secretion system protein TssA [endosymbiont of Galathealinum brachiosum]
MASEEIIQLDSLLQPISEDNPVGDDIREDSSPTSAYYSIKDARNAARAAERNNMFDGDSSEADDQWRKILELAPDILQNNAKDLEVASWYTEALIRRYGFQGLRDGFRLIHGLIDQYWDNLYPLPDEDGVETRVASLTGLNGEGAEGVIIAPIRNVLITQGNEPGPFSLWKYQQALEVEKIIDEEAKSDKASKLGFSNEDVERCVSESSEEFFVNICDDVSISIDTYREIGSMLDEYCGINDAPPISNIINILTESQGAINHIGKYKIPADDAGEMSSDESGDASDPSGESTGQVAQASGPIKTRADAFKKLIEISEFFRKTEPHSPISYIIERAVKWGDMPLDDLMKELIPDSSARDFYGSLTGVKTEDEY